MNIQVEIDGVNNTSRYLAIMANETKENDVISITVTTNLDVSGFLLIEGEEYDTSSTNGVWISDQYASKNNYKISDEITLKYGAISITGVIKGLIKSSEYLICTPGENQMTPDFNTYGYIYISPEMLKKAVVLFNKLLYRNRDIVSVPTNLGPKLVCEEIIKHIAPQCGQKRDFNMVIDNNKSKERS